MLHRERREPSHPHDPRPLMADNLKGIPFSSDDEGIDFQMKAKLLVQQQYNEWGIGTRKGETPVPLQLGEIYVVMYAYVLGGWKALISTSRPDGRYYEITYNHAKCETYLDTYLKTHNISIADA